ncbi:MAG TPA: DUF72 domain-containing protein [Aggregatilineales bacterium]|nr:DUF72 domain-containing protein [Aggregatilineales bacterium]
MLYVGCAIWAYDGWAKDFFPRGLPKDDRLKAYAGRLTAVEGNNTFYAVPTLAAVRRWSEQTPETFRFSPKFPRAISHAAQLKNVNAQTGSFIGVMRMLGPRLGPLMLQLPPSFSPSRLPLLRSYLENLPKDVQVAVEVRHPDWFTDDYTERLNETLLAVNAAKVVFDVRPAHSSDSPDADSAKERKPDVPLVADALQSYVVVRYISSPVMEENDQYLGEWTKRIAKWLKEDRDVYFYTHCPREELSPFVARELYRRVSKVTELPPLPWDSLETPSPPAEKPVQLSLF